MTALVVLRNGIPKMMGGSHSSPMSMTRKSWGHSVSVFHPGGHTNEWNLYACSPFQRRPYVQQGRKRHKDLSWFEQEKALRPAGEESLYYLAPKCLYRGEYRHGMNWDGVRLLYYVCLVLCRVSCICSWTSPFIVPRRDPEYMYRRQSRGRLRYGALTYSRPPYRHGIEPSCLVTLMMIKRACWHLLTPLEYWVVIPTMALECTMVFIRTQIIRKRTDTVIAFTRLKVLSYPQGNRRTDLRSNLTKIDR